MTDRALAAVSQHMGRMKRFLGLGIAAIVVLLQLAAVAAAWPSEAELHLAPVDNPALGDVRAA